MIFGNVYFYLNNSAVWRVKCTRRLWALHKASKISVGNDVSHRVLDRVGLLLPFVALLIEMFGFNVQKKVQKAQQNWKIL